MKKSLLALALGGFGIGLTEFVVMGLNPDIAGGFALTIPQAGYMISAYACGVVVGAPLSTVFAIRMAPHRTRLALMGIFTLFNGISCFAPNFDFLVLMRFLSGLPHGAFFGIGAVAVMFAGLTFANIFGMPLATFVGHQFDWRWAFAMVTIVGFLTLIAIELWIPDMTSICLLLHLAFVLCLNGMFAHSYYVLPVLTLITGAVAMSVCPPIQMLLMANAGDAEMLGASLGQAAFNIGNALAAALGGVIYLREAKEKTRSPRL